MVKALVRQQRKGRLMRMMRLRRLILDIGSGNKDLVVGWVAGSDATIQIRSDCETSGGYGLAISVVVK